jgi:pSer/pThr/pTyr-binding forkhead associated (FHA) protein
VTSYKLIIAVDPTLRNSASPDAPTDNEVVAYAIAKPVNLVGRKSEARAIFPEISLDSDSAVSHRHGLISQTPEGLLTYRDLSSSNGTRLNGKDVTSLVDIPLNAGDQLTLGHWTRITVEPNS